MGGGGGGCLGAEKGRLACANRRVKAQIRQGPVGLGHPGPGHGHAAGDMVPAPAGAAGPWPCPGAAKKAVTHPRPHARRVTRATGSRDTLSGVVAPAARPPQSHRPLGRGAPRPIMVYIIHV